MLGRPAARQRGRRPRSATSSAADDFYSDAHRLIYRAHHAADRRRQAGRRRHAVRSARRRRRSSTTSAGSPTSARWCRTCRPPRTSATTRRSCASARSCASSRRPPARSPIRRTTRSAATRKMVLDEAEAKVLHIAEQGARGTQNFQEIGKLLASVVERIETLYNRDDPSDVTGVPTGFADLDRMTSGFQPGDLDHRRRPTEHGQDGAGAEHRRARRARHRACRSPCSRWKWARAARDADDRLGRPARPAQAAHRPARRRGLGQALRQRSAD